ncbi:MAG: glycosyltransferase family 2 protein [Solirubrobacterales bacterium]
MTTDQEVTLGVPVYRGADFVAEALRSIQQQTHRQLRVLVSVDGPDDSDSEEAVRPFLDDSRFRMVVQPRNLGWARNISWLMDQVESPFWCYQQQDDLLEPRYLEALLAHAREAPEASIVYCDMERFGTKSGTITQKSLMGSAFTRQLTQMTERWAAVAFRGLTRLEAVRGAGGVPTNEADCYSCDTAWVAAAARYGEHHRLAVPLYRKRFHLENETLRWKAWSTERRAWAWLVHCADMVEQAMVLDIDHAERQLLWGAALVRVLSGRARPSVVPSAGTTSAEREEVLESFLGYLRNQRAIDLPRLLGVRWRRIRRWAWDFSWAG